MKIFIDLDNTLFYSQHFFRDLRKVFRKHGVSKNMFYKHYAGYSGAVSKKGRLLKKYDLEQHLKIIKDQEKLPINLLRKDIEKFLTNSSKYVFPDVKSFLKKFKKEDLLIVSFGKASFQKKKIKHAGFMENFSDAVVSDRMKGVVIKELIRKHKIPRKEIMFFIDDRTRQIDDVKLNIPNIKTILIRREEAKFHNRPNKQCDYVVKNLSEVKKIIKKLNE